MAPKKNVLRRDCVGTRSLNYIELDAAKNAIDWGMETGSFKLMDKEERLHLHHQSNQLIMAREFITGVMRDVWVDDDTPHSVVDFDDQLDITAFRAGAGGDVLVINAKDSPKKKMGAVFWKRPHPIQGYLPIADLLCEIVTRSGKTFTADLDYTVQGCKSCNDIMTQHSTQSHFLARDTVSGVPLVDDEVILKLKCNKQGRGYRVSQNGPIKIPSDPSKNDILIGGDFQAIYAYYVHRCMPVRAWRDAVVAIPNGNALLTSMRTNLVIMACLILNIAALVYERYYGLYGGTKNTNKPPYRYRGCIELYFSYLFYILLRNDNMEGEQDGAPGAGFAMDFPQFHRYYFTELIDYFIYSHPEYSGCHEISDVIFGSVKDLTGNALGPGSGFRMASVEDVLSFLCRSVVRFYNQDLKPCLSRHFAGLQPLDGADQLLFNRQMLAYNMLVARQDLVSLLHFMENCVVGDVDTFIESVGVHPVMRSWYRLLEMCPSKTVQLFDSFMNALTLIEFNNIIDTNNLKKGIYSARLAEVQYLMCNALELPTEPGEGDELSLLKAAPKCSPFKSALRIFLVGGVPYKKDISEMGAIAG